METLQRLLKEHARPLGYIFRDALLPGKVLTYFGVACLSPSGDNTAAAATCVNVPETLVLSRVVVRLQKVLLKQVRIGHRTVWTARECQIMRKCWHISFGRRYTFQPRTGPKGINNDYHPTTPLLASVATC